MKKLISFVAAIFMATALTACGNADRQDTGSQTDRTTENKDTAAQTENEQQAESSTDAEAGSGTEANGSNILVAYFSLAGEQYNVGVIEEGNTSIIAKMIAEQTNADLFEIQAVTPYPESHDELLEVSQEEMAENARPEIAGTVDNMESYDTVFIGYPNWWGDMPMIVYNFLESYDFAGKTVVPFCTHGGSGLSGTESTIADITGASMMDGFAISGETAQNNREESQEEVAAWLKDSGFEVK